MINSNFRRGFTLLEVVFALSFLIIGVAGVFVMLNKAMAQFSIFPRQFIGANLAQEGIEIIRNIRDTNWIEGEATWNDILVGADPINGKICQACGYNTECDSCQVDITTESLTNNCGETPSYNCGKYFYLQPRNLSISSVPSINHKKAYAYYSVVGFTNTNYSRQVILEPFVDGNIYAIRVTVIVRWREKLQSFEARAQEILYDWYINE